MSNQQHQGIIVADEKEATYIPIGFNFFDQKQFDTMQRVCNLFASSELVPDMYKAVQKAIPAGADEQTVSAINAENQAAKTKAIANCMIALEISQRVGASPLMVMQNMVPIYGKPSWSSKFLIATVNTCGRFKPLQFRFTDKGMLGMVDYVEYVFNGRFKEAKTCQFDGKKIMDVECVAFTTARGSDEVLESSPVSLRLAIQEGWYTKNGSKWRTMPKQMLMYRAASFWTSAYAPELSMGMRTVEENQDIYADFEEVPTPQTEEGTKQPDANSVEIGKGLAEEGERKESPENAEVAPTEEQNAPSDEQGETEKPTPGF